MFAVDVALDRAIVALEGQPDADEVIELLQAAKATVIDLNRRPPFPFTRPEQELGRAWALVASGDLAGARRQLLTAADLAATTGYRGTEAWLLHDVVRLGDPASVVDRLAALSAVCEGDLVEAYAAHAAAAAAGTPDGLVDATDRFERLGAGFQARLRDGFLALAAEFPARCRIVSAAGTTEAVAARIAAEVEP